MTTTIEKQQTSEQLAKQKLGNATEQGTGKTVATVAGGRLFPLGDDKSSTAVEPQKATVTQTSTATTATNESATKAATTTTTNTTTTTTTSAPVQYDVEHLATFSTASGHEQQVGAAATTTTTTTSADDKRDESSKIKLKQATTNDSSSITQPREALQKLFELEKLSGIWTQRMQIELQTEFMLIVDCETNSVVEQFQRDRVTKPEAFSHYNDIYNNIIVFNIDQPSDQSRNSNIDDGHHHDNSSHKEKTRNKRNAGDSCDKTSGELHIFQCVSHGADQLVSDILVWKGADGRTGALSGDSATTAPDDSSNSRDKMPPAPGPTSFAHSNPAGSALDAGRDANKASSASSSSNKGRSAEEASGKEVMRKSSAEDESTPSSATAAPTSDSNSSKPVITVASSSKPSETVPIVNVNVKETVQVFNQIAALREKSTVSQGPRPLSDASSSSQTGSSNSSASRPQSQPNEFSRAHQQLGSSGQSYKQRSIRATLAPNAASDTAATKQQSNQDRSTSSSSSMTSSAAQTNDARKTHTVQDHHQNGRRHSSRDSSSGQAPSTSSASSTSSSAMAAAAAAGPTATATATTTTTASASHHEGKTQKASGQRHTTAAAASGGSHTRSGSPGHHNHNHQPLGRGKSSNNNNNNHNSNNNNKPGPASSRLPATNGHHHPNHHGNHQGASLSIQSASSFGHPRGSPPLVQQQQAQSSPLDQVTSNESYVSVLNHCFDDIEKFILRIQHAYAAMRELQAKKRQTKRTVASQSIKSHPNGPLPPVPQPALSASELAMLSAQARGPGADDFFEILSKFKLAFNLLAKLKGCIHEPNAPELVHFLFTPLAIIIESARNVTPPVDPTAVGIPYLNSDALDLLSNCCTSKESDLWLSLGPNWTETIDVQLLKASRLPSSFQPIFSDGWAPVISELELIGLVVPPGLAQKSEADSHYGPGGGLRSAGGGGGVASHPMMDEPRQTNHGQLMRNGQPLPVYSSSSTNDASMSSSNNNNTSSASNSSKARRASPNGAPNSRYANPILQAGYIRTPNDMIEGSLADGTGHPADSYRSPDTRTAYYSNNSNNSNKNNNSQSHRSARNALPLDEVSSRSSKHLGNGSGSWRSHDYVGQPQVGPVANSFVGPKDDHLNGLYPSGHLPTNPPDDYTDLQDSHYLAGPSVRHNDEHLSHNHHHQHHHHRHHRANPLNSANDQSRRRASKSSYNRQYPTKAHYGEEELEEDGQLGHDLMVHEVEREAMLVDMGPAQTEWFYELKLRGALIVRVLFTREANNDKELTVERGEILEVLDDTRKWWKARNINLQVAYVPHTIVAVMGHYQTLDELLTGSSGDMMMMINDDPTAIANSQRYAHRELRMGEGDFQNHHGFMDERRNSKTAKGAFRYF